MTVETLQKANDLADKIRNIDRIHEGDIIGIAYCEGSDLRPYPMRIYDKEVLTQIEGIIRKYRDMLQYELDKL